MVIFNVIHKVMAMLTPGTGSGGPARQPALRLLGRPVCVSAFRKLLGLGWKRFQRLQTAQKKGQPCPVDGRFIRRTRLNLIGGKQKDKRAVVVAYLEELLQTIAEPMPEAWKDQDVPREMAMRRPKGHRPMKQVAKQAAKDKDRSGMRLLPPGSYSDYLRLLNETLDRSSHVTLKTFNSEPCMKRIFFLGVLCVKVFE